MDAKTIRNVNLCHGKNLQRKNALYVAVICWKKGISWYVRQNTVDMWRQNSRNKKILRKRDFFISKNPENSIGIEKK